MGHKRALLYEIMGKEKRALSPRSGGDRKSAKGRGRRVSSRPKRRLRAPVWRGRPGTLLAAGVVFLVVSGAAYYIGSLENGANSRPPGLLQRSFEEEPRGPAPKPVPPRPVRRRYWTVQVISYPDTPTWRKRAEELIEELIRNGFEDVHGLESDSSSMIGVAVGRYERKETLESLINELQTTKIGGVRPFRTAYARRITLE